MCPNGTLSHLLPPAPFSTFTFIRKHSGSTQHITAFTLTTKPPGKTHPRKCRGKEILRESSIITEGRRSRVQGRDLVISGLHLLRICRPNSVQSVSGHGEHEWQVRIHSFWYISDVREMRAGDCQLGTVKATPGKLLTRASRRNVGHPGRGGGGSWAGNRSRGIQLRWGEEGSRLAKTGCVTVSRPRSLL